MPFIYRDLDLEVDAAYVEPDVCLLDLAGGRRSSVITMSFGDRIRERRRIVFLGDAGVGKTMVQRRTILELLSASGHRYLHPRERPYPIYIELKTIDVRDDTPLLTYLLTEAPPIAARGPKGLLRLARNRQLFLFFDGYDEAQVTADRALQKELATLFGPVQSVLEGPNAEIYTALRTNRIWLSSRIDFFAVHSLTEDYRWDSGYTGDRPASVEIVGVGTNRRGLVRHIFDKYRQRSERYRDLLSEEVFLSLVDTSPDDELASLSNNPLFLTVMAYVYVKRVIDDRLEERQWFVAVDELIDECTRLLLVDLDREKARGLPELHRRALLTRRNLHSEEKLVFLRWFAWKLYADGRSVFDKPYLRASAQEFFASPRGAVPEATRPAIFRNLHTDEGDVRALDNQLIFSGVLIPLRRRGDTLYDLPHRRFREVLALSHLLENGSTELMLDAPDAEMSELLILAFRRAPLRGHVVRTLLRAATLAPSSPVPGRTLLRAIRGGPSFDARWSIQEFIRGQLARGQPFMLPSEVWRMTVGGQDWTDELTVAARRGGVGVEARVPLSVALTALSFADLARCREVCIDLLDEGVAAELVPIVLSTLASFSPKAVADYLAQNYETPHINAGLSILARARPRPAQIYLSLDSALPDRLRGRLSFYVLRHDPEAFARLRPSEDAGDEQCDGAHLRRTPDMGPTSGHPAALEPLALVDDDYVD
jgi:hypothetical protein